MTMGAITGAIGQLVTGSTSWLGTMVTTVVGAPLLLFFVISGFVGIGIGLLMRFVKR